MLENTAPVSNSVQTQLEAGVIGVILRKPQRWLGLAEVSKGKPLTKGCNVCYHFLLGAVNSNINVRCKSQKKVD